MKLRIPTVIDRIGACALTAGIIATFGPEFKWFEWISPFLVLCLAYPALLAISTWWSLFLFALYSVPATMVAYIWCDSSPGAGPFGLTHFFHSMTIPLLIYGLVRSGWETVVKAGEDYDSRNPKAGNPA